MAGGKKGQKAGRTPTKNNKNNQDEEKEDRESVERSNSNGDKSKQKKRSRSASEEKRGDSAKNCKKSKKCKGRVGQTENRPEIDDEAEMGENQNYTERAECDDVDIRVTERNAELLGSSADESAEDSEGEENDTETREDGSSGDFNNNATGYEGMQRDFYPTDADSDVIQFKASTRTRIQDEEDEEERFMERFAKFLEKRDKRKAEEYMSNARREEKIQKTDKTRRIKNSDGGNTGKIITSDSNSGTTIYKPALEVESQKGLDSEIQRDIQYTDPRDRNKEKRGSSSSEDLNVGSSGEFDEINAHKNVEIRNGNDNIDKLISEIRREARQLQIQNRDERYVDDGEQPHCSRDQPPTKDKQSRSEKAKEPTPEEQAAQLIKQAEKAKARMLEMPGKRIDRVKEDLVDREFSGMGGYNA